MPLTRFIPRETAAARVNGFTAHLRDNGLRVGPQETAAAIDALSQIDPTDRLAVRSAFKAVCATSKDEVTRFDDLFAAYWMAEGRGRERQGQGSPSTRSAAPLMSQAMGGKGENAGADDMGGEADSDGSGRLISTRTVNRTRTDLRNFVTPEDIAAAEATAARIARAIRDHRSRRLRAGRGTRADMRRIMRRSLSTDGEPLHLFTRQRPERPAQITAILDVSGSMQVYARVFLAFLRGLVGADLKTDAYLFHTRLVRITDALRDGDHLRAVNRLSLLAQGFGGGTKIGSALTAFNDGYARGRVNGRSVVVILSDGYDTDPPEVISAQLARLKKRGCRIVWLNPLAGWKDYAPVAAGMAAAMPHLSLFAAANTLQSLADLEPEFTRI